MLELSAHVLIGAVVPARKRCPLGRQLQDLLGAPKTDARPAVMRLYARYGSSRMLDASLAYRSTLQQCVLSNLRQKSATECQKHECHRPLTLDGDRVEILLNFNKEVTF